MRTTRSPQHRFIHTFTIAVSKAKLADPYVSPVFHSDDTAALDIFDGQLGLVVQIQRSSVDPDRVDEPNWWTVDEVRFSDPTDIRAERYTINSKGWWRLVAFLDGETEEFTQNATLQLLAGRLTDETDTYQKRRRRRTILEANMMVSGGNYTLRRALPHEALDYYPSDSEYLPEDFGQMEEDRQLARNQFGAECLNVSSNTLVYISEYRANYFTSKPPKTYYFGEAV